MEKIDLHIHSSFSDGDNKIQTLTDMLEQGNFKLFAITDHDNVNSILTLKDYDKIKHIPGVEMSCVYGKIKMHLLGYFISSNGEIAKICNEVSDRRRNLIGEFVDDLISRGYFFQNEDLKRFTSDDIVTGKVDIAKALVKNGYATTVREAFNEILGKYQLGKYIRNDLKIVVDKIKDDGGLCILAHPGDIEKKYSISLSNIINELCEMGIDGLEVYTTKHDENQKQKFLQMCRGKNLLVTGGSDYHGPLTTPSINIGDSIIGDDISDVFKR